MIIKFCTNENIRQNYDNIFNVLINLRPLSMWEMHVERWWICNVQYEQKYLKWNQSVPSVYSEFHIRERFFRAANNVSELAYK